MTMLIYDPTIDDHPIGSRSDEELRSRAETAYAQGVAMLLGGEGGE